MVDYRKLVAEDLKDYKAMKEGICNNKERIAELEAEFERIKGGAGGTASLRGGGNATEDKLINNIAERDRYELNNRATTPLVLRIERSLRHLNETELKVIVRMYINEEKGAVLRLCEELNYEKSMIYKIKDAAIHKLALAMYGIEAL